MSSQDNKMVVQEFYDQWNSGAIELERLVQPDVTNHQPGRKPEEGLDDFRRAIEGVMKAVPDSTWTTRRLIAEDDLVVCHNTWSGTYGGSELPWSSDLRRRANLGRAHPHLPLSSEVELQSTG